MLIARNSCPRKQVCRNPHEDNVDPIATPKDDHPNREKARSLASAIPWSSSCCDQLFPKHYAPCGREGNLVMTAWKSFTGARAEFAPVERVPFHSQARREYDLP